MARTLDAIPITSSLNHEPSLTPALSHKWERERLGPLSTVLGGEGWGRSGAFKPQAVCPHSDLGLQAQVRTAGEGARQAKLRRQASNAMNPPGMSPRDLLRRLFDAAIASAQPALCIPPHLPATLLPASPKGRVVVIGAGKASAAMAQAVENAWCGNEAASSKLSGLVVTR